MPNVAKVHPTCEYILEFVLIIKKAISHVFSDCVRILRNLKAAYLGSTHVEINPYLIQIKDLNDRGQTLRGYL